MLNQPTLEHLRALKLDGMARGLEEQRGLPAAFQDLSFDERIGILVDHERHWRDERRLKRLLKHARLKHPEACIENIDYRADRGLQRATIASLASNDWIRQGHSLLLTGPTGYRSFNTSGRTDRVRPLPFNQGTVVSKRQR